MTREPAEPLRLDYLIKAGTIHSMTGQTYRSVGLRGAEIAAAVVAAELTATGTPSCVPVSAHCRDSTAARSDSRTQAASRHGTKFPIW